jgi:hypothetical protein
MTAEERLRGLEEQKMAMLRGVSAWPVELLGTPPGNGRWSALQVLDHVVRVEMGISAEVVRGLGDPQRIGIRDRAGFIFVEQVLRSRRKVKVPAAVPKVLPGEGLELQEITVRWDRTRVELARLACVADGCHGGVFKHPVSGWMSFEQVLRFCSVHMAHHEFQLERIRADIGAI